MRHIRPLIILCLLLTVTLLFASCKANKISNDYLDSIKSASKTEIGVGEKQFTFSVEDKDGNSTVFLVNTDKKTVGEALSELELIEGEEGPYGIFIKSVNGITLDFNKDGLYWAFYINGDYANGGVDTTDITEGDIYILRAQK